MIFFGIPYDSLNDCYYLSLDEVDNESKAIYKWLRTYIFKKLTFTLFIIIKKIILILLIVLINLILSKEYVCKMIDILFK